MARPWETIERVETDAGRLELRRRGDRDFLITIAERVLMSSTARRSEEALGDLGARLVAGRAAPRVLIGGLGMGYTLRAALDVLPAAATVVVAELNPAVVAWCRGPVAPLTDGAVDDPRTTVALRDVALVIAAAAGAPDEARFDAILLDLYEGPRHATQGAADPLYGDDAVRTTRRALRPDGVFAVWSEFPDRPFEERLAANGFRVERRRPGRGGSPHVVYVARLAGRQGQADSA